MNGAALSALSKAGWSTVRPTQRPWSAICVHTSLLEGEELELQLLDRILRRASRSSPLPEDSIDRLRGEGRLIERGATGTPAAEGRAAVPDAPFARFQSAPAALPQGSERPASSLRRLAPTSMPRSPRPARAA